MKWRGLIAGVVVACTAIPFALAQSGLDTPANAPRLGDIMIRIQARHIKLWFAGQAQNWPLAAYELNQLRTSLAEAAVLYSGIPVTNVATMMTPIQAIFDSIEAKDTRRFTKAVGDLTDGCNACHGAMDRSFVMIRTPADNPFTNQVFRQPPR